MSEPSIFPLKETDVLFIYDTETSDVPLFNRPSEDPAQPKVIQLTALLTDYKGRKLSSLDALLAWPDLVMAEEAQRIHGLTPEHCARYGVDPHAAFRLFHAMWRRATVRIGHNESFDARMVRIYQKQHPERFDEEFCQDWKDGKAYCTQRLTKGILKLPPTERMKETRFRNSFKSPNLREAYFWATGKEMDNAHNAMYDVLAAKSVFFAVQHYTLTQAAQPESVAPADAAPAQGTLLDSPTEEISQPAETAPAPTSSDTDEVW